VADEQTEPAIPQDLIDLQRAWWEAESAWVADPTDRAVYEAFIKAGTMLYFHPHWVTVMNRFKTTQELRTLARPATQQPVDA
jgi:hypothetical protein